MTEDTVSPDQKDEADTALIVAAVNYVLAALRAALEGAPHDPE